MMRVSSKRFHVHVHSILVSVSMLGTVITVITSQPSSGSQEALCFGWIDSTYRPLSGTLGMQRYTPRRKIAENYSQPNVERLQWVDRKRLIHPEAGEVGRGWDSAAVDIFDV